MFYNGGGKSRPLPDLANGRVYCVCIKCCSHTYIETGYIGYYINSPDLLESNDTVE